MSQVRSVTLFRTAFDLILSLSYFQVLHVLDLEGCDFRESCHNNLRWVENLLHLRYLGLRDTYTFELSIEIGKLRFLETLDLSGRGCGSEVPSSVVGLRHLMCLCVDDHMKMPVGMGNLASLEELTVLRVDGSDEIAKELGQLIELRVLELCLVAGDESVGNSLMVSIGKLHKLQSLTIYSEMSQGLDTMFNVSQDGWVPPPHLRTLEFHHSTLPRWINSSSLPLLSDLRMNLDVVRGEDIQILGKLPALRFICLETSKAQFSHPKRFSVGADAFPRVTKCLFDDFMTVPSMFPRGAMPRLEYLHFCAPAWDIASGELDVGMAHLPSLQRVHVSLWTDKGSWSEEANAALNSSEEANAALRLAVDAHPNRPTFTSYIQWF